MAFPQKEIISAGTTLKVALINTGNAPVLHTISAAAAAIGATSVSLTLTTPNMQAGTTFFLQHDTLLQFGATRVRVNIPDTSTGISDGVAIGATAVSVPVLPLTSAVAANATTQAYELYSVLGITDASPSEQPQTEDTTDMLSGFGQKQTVVGINRTITVNGIRIEGDRAMFNVVDPVLRRDADAAKLIWAELTTASGDIRKGTARVTDASGQNQVRSTEKYSLTLTFQGNNFDFKSGSAPLFA